MHICTCLCDIFPFVAIVWGSAFVTMTVTPCTMSGPQGNGFPQFDVKELALAAQSPDPNPIQHLWDELEC